jgi:hypothetical protein
MLVGIVSLVTPELGRSDDVKSLTASPARTNAAHKSSGDDTRKIFSSAVSCACVSIVVKHCSQVFFTVDGVGVTTTPSREHVAVFPG